MRFVISFSTTLFVLANARPAPPSETILQALYKANEIVKETLNSAVTVKLLHFLHLAAHGVQDS